MLCFKFFAIMTLLATTIYVGIVLAGLVGQDIPVKEAALKEWKKTYNSHFQTVLLLLLLSVVFGIAYVVTLYYV